MPLAARDEGDADTRSAAVAVAVAVVVVVVVLVVDGALVPVPEGGVTVDTPPDGTWIVLGLDAGVDDMDGVPLLEGLGDVDGVPLLEGFGDVLGNIDGVFVGVVDALMDGTVTVTPDGLGVFKEDADTDGEAEREGVTDADGEFEGCVWCYVMMGNAWLVS